MDIGGGALAKGALSLSLSLHCADDATRAAILHTGCTGGSLKGRFANERAPRPIEHQLTHRTGSLTLAAATVSTRQRLLHTILEVRVSLFAVYEKRREQLLS